MQNRVKYYPANDFAHGHHLDRIETMYPAEPYTLIQDINDALELYNITLYFDDSVRLKTWSDEDHEKYSVYSKSLMPAVYRFFNTITEETFMTIINDLDIFYQEDFWFLFERTKLYNKISEAVFQAALDTKRISLRKIMQNKPIVEHYGRAICLFLQSKMIGAEIIIEALGDPSRRDLHLPSKLSTSERDDIIRKYIDGKEPNPNILLSIAESQYSPPIPAKIKLAAERRYNDYVKVFFEKNEGIKTSTRVSFQPGLSTAKTFVFQDNTVAVAYDLTWIEENLDYPTLLNNFIFLFEFTDLHMRITHISKKSELGVFERVLGGYTDKRYHTGVIFTDKEMLATLEMLGYCDILEKNDIHLENVIAWFFNDYLVKEFDAPRFIVNMPSAGTAFSEKCVLLSATMDSLIKQYRLLAQNGSIDFELLKMDATSVKYQDIPSTISPKYAYGCGESYSFICHLLFSDQSILSYVERLPQEYDSFFELLTSEDVYWFDYHESCIASLNCLVKEGLLAIDDDKKIRLCDIEKAHILGDAYRNEAININHYPVKMRTRLMQLVQEGYLIVGNTLLSEPESAFFNYYLNRADCLNGLDLRNEYIHGVLQTTETEETHKKNYFILLRLFILLVIKING